MKALVVRWVGRRVAGLAYWEELMAGRRPLTGMVQAVVMAQMMVGTEGVETGP